MKLHTSPARPRLVVLTLLAAVAFILPGCSDKTAEPFKDAPRDKENDSGTPMRVIRMSDGFSNVGAKCDGPNMVYVVYHGDGSYGSVQVAPNDPRCTGDSGGSGG